MDETILDPVALLRYKTAYDFHGFLNSVASSLTWWDGRVVVLELCSTGDGVMVLTRDVDSVLMEREEEEKDGGLAAPMFIRRILLPLACPNSLFVWSKGARSCRALL